MSTAAMQLTTDTPAETISANGFSLVKKQERLNSTFYLIRSGSAPCGQRLALVQSKCGTALYCTDCKQYGCAHTDAIRAMEARD
jgi:hypothetical protein